jgi:hypothetical protein
MPRIRRAAACVDVGGKGGSAVYTPTVFRSSMT